ncbi:hypothetical protein BGX23_009773 [Mortierella sp. AD031]|nr:hypothetical protein BGX23_009773 [Mortierella sp. AD031]
MPLSTHHQQTPTNNNPSQRPTHGQPTIAADNAAANSSLHSDQPSKALHNISLNAAIIGNSNNNSDDTNDGNALPGHGHHLHMDPERRNQDQEQGHPGRASVATALPSVPYSSFADKDHSQWGHRRWSYQASGSPRFDSTVDMLSGSLEHNTLSANSSSLHSNPRERERERESRLSKSFASTLSSVHENFAQPVVQDSANADDCLYTHTTTHARPRISIDTSPTGLQRRRSPASFDPSPFAHRSQQQQTTLKSSLTAGLGSSAASRQPHNTPSQLSLGLDKEHGSSCGAERKTSADPSSSILSSSISRALPTQTTTPSLSKRRTSLTWAPSPVISKETSSSSQGSSQTHSTTAAVAAPIVSSPSVDDKDVYNNHSINIPTSRHRSKSFSSVTSNDPFSSSYASHRSNSFSAPKVTSSSYSSLPYSPAVAFLSNFVDVTAPKVSLDEEGAQVGGYLLGRVIGHGGFSIVREATSVQMDESGQVERVAVKIVKTQTGASDNDRVQKMLRKEIAIWSQISHPHVLPFLAVEELPTDTFIFCELCTGGHLLNYLSRRGDVLQRQPATTTPTTPGSAKPLEEDEARAIFNQVVEAIRYLHEEKRIVHRDIKLENILHHENGTWKICDFGLAEYQDEEAALRFGESLVSPTGASSAVSATETPLEEKKEKEEEEEEMCGGSLAYSSPEQLRSCKPLRYPSSDVWSLGVVLYALLTGRLPFQDEYEPRLQYQILNGRYEDPVECSAEARSLLKNMFRSKPEDRWRIGQVKDCAWCVGIVDHSLGGGDGGGGSQFDQPGNNSMSSFLSTFRSTL